MRIPVIDIEGKPLMPCRPGRARLLLDQGKAVAFRNKLGIFCIRLKSNKLPDNQLLVLGIDPGSKWEGYSVVGLHETVLNCMCTARGGVKEKIEQRRNMRRTRRHRKWRRPSRNNNRLTNEKRIPPSTRARWELKYRVVSQLLKILPIREVVIEDVCAETRKSCRRWNKSFSPVQAGKNHLYRLLEADGLRTITKKGFETKELRDVYGLKKTKDKSAKTFESHAVDAWVMAANQTGALAPSERGLWYMDLARPVRRQLFKFQTKKDGYREPFGGTRSNNYKRGALVFHADYRWCFLGTCKSKGGKRIPSYLGWNVLSIGGRWTTSYPVRGDEFTVCTYTPYRTVYSRPR